MSNVQGLFGGGAEGDAKKAQAEDFINRYQTGNPSEGYTEEEALAAFQEVSKIATPEQMQLALQQSVANLPDNDRAEFNQMLQDRQAGTGMIDIERSGDRKEVTSRDAEGASNAMPGLDDILGGLLGGSTGSSSGSSGGLGDILGGLLGGATGATAAPASDSGDSDGGLGDMISGFLGSSVGKAVLAGTAAYAMKEILGQK